MYRGGILYEGLVSWCFPHGSVPADHDILINAEYVSLNRAHTSLISSVAGMTLPLHFRLAESRTSSNILCVRD